MSRKGRGLGLLLGAVAIGVTYLVKKHYDEQKEDDKDEVHFINIDDDDDEDEPHYDASNKSEEVQEVCKVYPYLRPDFVEEALNNSKELNDRFNENTLVNVTHKVKFENQDNLEKFLTIMSNQGYVCVQLGDGNMTVTKSLYTGEDALTSEILNVANQTAALHGTYESQDLFENN